MQIFSELCLVDELDDLELSMFINASSLFILFDEGMGEYYNRYTCKFQRINTAQKRWLV